jgi:hypothetical protein
MPDVDHTIGYIVSDYTVLLSDFCYRRALKNVLMDQLTIPLKAGQQLNLKIILLFFLK